MIGDIKLTDSLEILLKQFYQLINYFIYRIKINISSSTIYNIVFKYKYLKNSFYFLYIEKKQAQDIFFGFDSFISIFHNFMQILI